MPRVCLARPIIQPGRDEDLAGDRDDKLCRRMTLSDIGSSEFKFEVEVSAAPPTTCTDDELEWKAVAMGAFFESEDTQRWGADLIHG